MKNPILRYLLGILTIPFTLIVVRPLVHSLKWATIDTYNFIRRNQLSQDLPKCRWIDAPFRIFWRSFKETLKDALNGWKRTA